MSCSRLRCSLGRLIFVGILIAGALAASAGRGEAGIAVYLGDVLCRVEAPGPRYFHSEVDGASVDRRLLGGRDEWSRRLERRTLEYVATKFAGYVAEHYDVEYLLSPRCELIQLGSGAEEIGTPAGRGLLARWPVRGLWGGRENSGGLATGFRQRLRLGACDAVGTDGLGHRQPREYVDGFGNDTGERCPGFGCGVGTTSF